MKIKAIIITISILLFCTSGYTLDWKSLHEKADTTSLEEALADVRKNPDSLDSLYVLGLVYLNGYKIQEAEKVFRKMLEIDLSTIEAQWGVAECLRRKKKCGICVRVANEIIASNPGFAPAYITLAYIKYMQRSFDESAKLFYRVIKLGKENVDLTNFVRAYSLFAGAKGMVAHYGGPISKVINGRPVMPYLKKAQELQPDSPVVLFGMGSYYLLIPPAFGRNVDKAIEYLEKAAKADPLFADVYVRLGQAYGLKGDEEKYQKYIQKALEIDPQNILALDIKNGTCKFICVGSKD